MVGDYIPSFDFNQKIGESPSVVYYLNALALKLECVASNGLLKYF